MNLDAISLAVTTFGWTREEAQRNLSDGEGWAPHDTNGGSQSSQGSSSSGPASSASPPPATLSSEQVTQLLAAFSAHGAKVGAGPAARERNSRRNAPSGMAKEIPQELFEARKKAGLCCQVRRRQVRAWRPRPQLQNVQGRCGQDDQRGGGHQEGEFLEGPAARQRQSTRDTDAIHHLAVSNGRPPDPPPPSLSPHRALKPSKGPSAPPTDPPPIPAPPPAAPPPQPRGTPPIAPTLLVPLYTPFVLNAASRHEFGVDGDKAGIILLRSTAGGFPATALWDTGAEAEFISWSYVNSHGLQGQMTPSHQRVKYADGSVREARGELTLPLRILTHGHPFERMTRFIVADLQPRFDLVLGTPFCRAHQPRPDWERMTILLPTTKRNGQVAWQPAYRASTRGTDPTDASSMALCEVSLEAMQQLSDSGQLDSDGQWLINIRREGSSSLSLNSVQPVNGPESIERARCEELRQELFASFAPVFPDKLPSVTADSPAPAGVVHKIQLKDGSQPYSRPLRRMSTQELDELKKQLQEYLDSGRLRPSESPWGTNVIFAKKKDGAVMTGIDPSLHLPLSLHLPFALQYPRVILPLLSLGSLRLSTVSLSLRESCCASLFLFSPFVGRTLCSLRHRR